MTNGIQFGVKLNLRSSDIFVINEVFNMLLFAQKVARRYKNYVELVLIFHKGKGMKKGNECELILTCTRRISLRLFFIALWGDDEALLNIILMFDISK